MFPNPERLGLARKDSGPRGQDSDGRYRPRPTLLHHRRWARLRSRGRRSRGGRHQRVPCRTLNSDWRGRLRPAGWRMRGGGRAVICNRRRITSMLHAPRLQVWRRRGAIRRTHVALRVGSAANVSAHGSRGVVTRREAAAHWSEETQPSLGTTDLESHSRLASRRRAA